MREFLSIGRALGDEARVRVLMALREGELCLCQIIELLRPLAPSTVSKHVSLLVQAGLLERRKQGRWHFYRLADRRAPATARRALRWTIDSLADDPTVVQDAEMLRKLRERDLEELSACYRD